MDDYDTKITRNGFIEYYDNRSMFHRVNGPALSTPFGDRMWFQHGKRHRLDGPAVIWKNKDEEYWINDIRYTKEEFKFITFCYGIKN